MSEPSPSITRLLEACCDGEDAVRHVYPLLYEELRRLAQHHFQAERVGHTLQATALVNEAYARVAGLREIRFRSKTHFMAVASMMIRRILVDHARARDAAKRGGGVTRVTLSGIESPASGHGVDLVGMDEALEQLTAMDPRQCQVVELRFFGALTVEQVADVLDVSPRTVKADWQIAKAWLYDRLAG